MQLGWGRGGHPSEEGTGKNRWDRIHLRLVTLLYVNIPEFKRKGKRTAPGHPFASNSSQIRPVFIDLLGVGVGVWVGVTVQDGFGDHGGKSISASSRQAEPTLHRQQVTLPGPHSPSPAVKWG